MSVTAYCFVKNLSSHKLTRRLATAYSSRVITSDLITVQNLVVVSHTVWCAHEQKSPQKIWDAGSRPIGSGTWLTPWKYTTPHMCHHTTFRRSTRLYGQTVWAQQAVPKMEDARIGLCRVITRVTRLLDSKLESSNFCLLEYSVVNK